jgi:outer membrane immunogenic protein
MIHGTLWAAALLMGMAAFASRTNAQKDAGPFSVDLGLTYVAERAKIATTSDGYFWLQGGSVEGAVPLFRHLSVAANLTGQHASNIAPGVDLSKLAFMAGPRYTLRTNRWTDRFLGDKHGTSVFGEGLFGGVHGFDSQFPRSTGLASSANAFSMQLGAGLNIGIGKGFGLRVLEVDYVYTNLPNGGNNAQSDLRLSFGLTYHAGR